MLITEHMDLVELAERMGDAAEAEAFQMREILVKNGYTGQTEDIPDDEWLALLEVAVLCVAKNGKE